MAVTCNGKTMDCSQGQVVQANPDVTGLGVLIAFMATSIITSLAILVAYVFDALPEEGDYSLVTSFDKAIITWIRQRLRRFDELEAHKKMARAGLLERFVLIMSDQQLVTGIAIFASGYINSCSVSAYHFLTITALGWFSATTHLSTLTVLRNYFEDFWIIRSIRFFAMLGIGDSTMPVQCLITQKGRIRDTNPVKFCCVVFQLSFLLIAYSVKSAKLFLAKSSNFSVRATIRRMFRSRRPIVNDRKEQYVRYLEKLHKSRSRRASVKAGLAICSFMFMECLDSFLWQLIWLFFMNFYGIRQIFWARLWLRGTLGDHLKGDENQWSFGQMVPPLLLALPALTLVEGYEGMNTFPLYQFWLTLAMQKLERSPLQLQARLLRSDDSYGRFTYVEVVPPEEQDPQESHLQRLPTQPNPLSQENAMPAQIAPFPALPVDPPREGESLIKRLEPASISPPTVKIEDQAATDSPSSPSGVFIGSVKSAEVHDYPSWQTFWNACDEAYSTTLSWRLLGLGFITALLLYAMVALVTIAWFMAGQYDAKEYKGVKAGVVMVCVLIAGASGPYFVECMRVAGY
ncbi:MAG: hypothetical protein M1828_000233 [Chrysothrix sp. TS-e1954]|nr:MAG: hypothetical protein M1828_000233 [Chrysothrix sp. TS-e1954]